jgi:hypothetical protein
MENGIRGFPWQRAVFVQEGVGLGVKWVGLPPPPHRVRKGRIGIRQLVHDGNVAINGSFLPP